MKNGWIALHRKIYTSTDFKNQMEVAVFMYLLSMASYQSSKVTYRKKTIILNRGDVSIAYRDLAKKFDTTVNKIRTIIKNLKSSGNITQTLHKRLSVFSIVKYSKYQDLPTEPKQEITHRRTTNTTITTSIDKNMLSLSSMTNKPKKITIPTLQSLQKKIIEKPRDKNEWEVGKERLDAQDYEKWVLHKLNS
jgi:hypothetical protein